MGLRAINWCVYKTKEKDLDIRDTQVWRRQRDTTTQRKGQVKTQGDWSDEATSQGCLQPPSGSWKR